MKYFAEFDTAGNKTAGYAADGMPYTEADIRTLFPNAVETSEEDFVLYTAGYIRRADGKPVPKPPYVPSLDELKAAKWTEIKEKRDQLEQSGVPYLGKIIDSDPVSVQRIAIAVQAAQAAISAGVEFSLDWTCADNTVLTMTAEQVVGMSVALAQHSDSLHQTARGLRAKIEAATTKEELDAIVWPE